MFDSTRPLLFVRALARVATSHENVNPSVPTHRRWASAARLLGEFVSLLALVHLAEEKDQTYGSVLGVFFAFMLPTLLLQDGAIRAVRRFARSDSVASHAAIGALGVLLCYALYEACVELIRMIES